MLAMASNKKLHGKKLLEWLEYDSGLRLAVTKFEDIPFDRVSDVIKKLDDYEATIARRN